MVVRGLSPMCLAVAVALLVFAGPAAATSPFAAASASSSARGAGAKLAVDGRLATAWRPSRRGRWTWRGRLRAAVTLDRVRVLTVSSVDGVRVGVSRDGRRYRHVRTLTLRRGSWRAVGLRGRRARFIRISGRASPRSRGGLVEVTVRTRPVGPAVVATGAKLTTPWGGEVAAADGAAPGAQAQVPEPAQDTGPVCAPRISAPPADSPGPVTPTTIVPAPDASGAAAPTPSEGRAFAGTVTSPIDADQLEGMPFGRRSHWLQPWRAYLDTPPARRLRDAIGINFNPEANDAAPVARLLAANGFRRARIEIPWGDFAYEDPSKLIHREKFERALCAIRDAGLRPLLLLNANDQQPVPSYRTKLTLAEDVDVDAKEITLDAESAERVKAPYTGIDGAFAAEAIIQELRGNVAVLSKPLSALPRFKGSAVPAGTVLDATVLKYLPFSPPTYDDDVVNPYSEETLDGWIDYVATATRFVRGMLGSSEFDIEISNELNLNAAFWNIGNYFPGVFSAPARDQVIVNRTVEWLRTEADLPGVRVTNGFASQRPWDSGATSPKGLDALSKHFYPRNLRFPDVMTCDTRADDPCPRADPLRRNTPVNAQGAPEGTKDSQGLWTDAFTPTYDAFFPEFWLTGIATETMVRDLAPREETFGGAVHGRAVAPAGGAPPEIWMTEMGLETGWVEDPKGGLGLKLTDADIGHLRAKAALRTLVSYVHKGVTQVDLYAAATREWGLVGGSFWDRWRETGRYPGDDTGGPVLDGVRRLVATLGADPITTARSLTLASIGDYGGRTQFAGDGTAGHPDLSDRDALAVFPFQASDHRFVIPVYVMTRNLARTYANGAAGPARFDLPAERYQLTLGGVDAARVRARAVDPLTGVTVPVDVVRRDGTWLVLEFPVTDSPRLLVLDDAGA